MDHGQKILAELGVEVGKVSSMEESVVVVVPSFFLEKYSTKKKKTQNKTKSDLISQLDGSQIVRGIRRVRLSTWSSIHGTLYLSHSYLMKDLGMLVVSFRGVNRKFRCY